MRILFLFLIRFYSLAVVVDHPAIPASIGVDDISFANEDEPELPMVCEIAEEEEDENQNRWYSIFSVLPHSASNYFFQKLVSEKFIKIIFRYILYLNIRT